jgi:predicted membrane protein
VTLPWCQHYLHYTNIIKVSNNFNFCMLLCGNNALKQKIVHSSMVYYVCVLLYNAANRYFTTLNHIIIFKQAKIGSDFNFYMLLSLTF